MDFAAPAAGFRRSAFGADSRQRTPLRRFKAAHSAPQIQGRFKAAAPDLVPGRRFALAPDDGPAFAPAAGLRWRRTTGLCLHRPPACVGAGRWLALAPEKPCEKALFLTRNSKSAIFGVKNRIISHQTSKNQHSVRKSPSFHTEFHLRQNRCEKGAIFTPNFRRAVNFIQDSAAPRASAPLPTLHSQLSTLNSPLPTLNSQLSTPLNSKH